ncbi:hypothetical protein FB451DRAFT_1521160 [Mycena latifolia]|nr:hypothetical protein FB451DRAFT_1521160 [Mycena latifolia]
MPQHSTNIHDSILQYTLVAADALQGVAAAAQIPFLKSVCTLTAAIIPMIEMLDQIAQYAETLQRFYACMTAQNELGTIKRFFRQSEITAQLDVCERELKAGLNLFTTQFGVGVASALVEMNIDAEKRHQELLELISARSVSVTATASLRGNSLNNSSGSLSLLPASPKIFHGRDFELNDIIRSLLTESPRVAVLGPGGMGKTALAMAALHHVAVTEKYNLRHFISSESANTNVESLSIIDTMGREWNLAEELKNFYPHWQMFRAWHCCHLLITMRGAERPGKVKWTRPFLPPLEPLAPSASRQMFAEVADGPEIGEESALEELLDLSGSLPLAISLMASVAAFEGYTSTLSRWKVENTTLLSDGHDKRSNLEISIALSLGSPRLSSSPHAKNLLSLLSILPDGITDDDLIICKVPLPNVPHSRTSLVRTSLAYVDGGGRLKALSPIREYIRRVYPPSTSLSKPLRTYFQELFTIWEIHQQLPSADLVPKIVSYLGNINGLMLQGLIDDQPALSDIGHSILTLNQFSHTMLKGSSSLTQHLPHLIEMTGDSRLRWSYACASLQGRMPPSVIIDAELLIAEGFEHFNTVQCHIEEAANFYNAAATSYGLGRNFREATKSVDRALLIGQRTNNTKLKFEAFYVKCNIAHSLQDGWQLMKLVREARTSVMGLEHYWLFFETFAHVLLGKFSRGLSLCTKVNALRVASGEEGTDRHLAMLDLQAEIHWRKSEYSWAHEIQAVVASKTSPSRSPLFHANALVSLAALDITMSSDEGASLLNLNAAEAIYRAHGSQRIGFCSYVMAEIYLRRGDTQNARVTFEECLSKSRGIYLDVTALCLAALGDPRHKMHNTSDWTFVYFSLVRKSKDRVATFHALRCLADIFAEFKDEETALNLYHAALEGATEMDIHRLRAESMTGIGDIMMRRVDSVKAEDMWQAARPLFVRSSQMKDAAGIGERLAQLSQGIQKNPVTVSGTSALNDISKRGPDTAETMGQFEKLDLLVAPKTSLLMDAGSLRGPAKELAQCQDGTQDPSPTLVEL